MNNELAKQNNTLAVAGNPVTGPTIGKALTMMLGAGLKTYGQHPMVDAWYVVLDANGVREEEIQPAMKHFLCRTNDDGSVPFPSATEFARWILRDREAKESAARMKEVEEYVKTQDAEMLRLRNLERYGTESPTREEVDSYMASKGLTETLKDFVQ